MLDQTIIAAYNRNMGNVCYAYAHRRGDRKQAVYVSMLFNACLAGVLLNRRCIKAALKSVTFDLFILEIMFLFFKNIVKILEFRYTFYLFRNN